MSRLLLLDGHSLAYRAFFALPVENFSTSTGQSTNAVFGFTSMLINVLRDEEPTHLAVAFDVSRQTFRTETYAEYKAGRAATPDEFKGQVDLIKQVLDALNITHLGVEGYEADDIIATLTHRGRENDLEVLICSGDRDALQLVDHATTVLYPKRGVSDLARMTPDAVTEKYGVPPELYSDLAAMVGEKSDNLPGVPGVGPKTAAKWITTHGDLAGVVDHADALTGKAGQSFRDHLDAVLLNRKLNALVTDLDLPVEIPGLERRGWDREEVHQLFDQLEFRVLRDRLFATVDAVEPEAEEGIEVDGAVIEPGSVTTWLQATIGSAPEVATGIHVDGTWTRGVGEATGLAISTGANAGYIDLSTVTPEDDAALGAWLSDPEVPKIAHDAKRQVHALGARGYTLAGLRCDTALVAYLVRPDQRSYDLADLVLRYLQRELRSDADASDQGTLDLDFDEGAAAGQAAMVHAEAARELAGILLEKVDEVEGRGLLDDVEQPLIDVLARMEQIGIGVDRVGLEALESDFGDAVAAAARDAWDAIDDDTVNLGSPKQLQAVLFDRLGLPKTRRTKTGYTTDAEALGWLYAQTEHPFLEALLRHRDATRLRSTVEGLLKSIADDGRIHTTYQQTIAATGRLSSTDPNLQNIPIRTSEGRRIRDIFVVGDGYESLMSADYSQIEMRIMAHLSAEPGLIQAYRDGEDLHRFVGARVFDVAPDEVSAEMRSKVKAMSYGLAYGLSSFGLSKQLGITTAEAKDLMDEYFARFGGVRDYLQDVVAEARGVGFTETMLGRRRYLPDLNSDNRQRREMAERMALNAPIQGTAADIIKVAMLEVDRRLIAAGLTSRVLLQVHDELVLEIAQGEADEVEHLVREAMGSAATLDVPLEVNIGLGQSWHAAEH